MARSILAPFATFLFVLALGFAGITWWALESGGVAIIETTRDDGSSRRTHLWFSEHGEDFWLEAGTPANGWYVDATSRHDVGIEIEGVMVRGWVEPVIEPGASDWVRILMRRKYGVRDQWVGLFVDSSESVAVRFHPRDDPPAPRADRRATGAVELE